MSEIRLQGIQKRFGGNPILADINLTIAPGEFCVFIGPSGCGKSTLLRLIAGLDDASGGELYIDGGYRANADNADLAAGYARVLVLSPLGGRSLTPGEWGTHLATQVAGLRASGSVVETILPDSAARAAFGPNLMDPSTRAPIARAGYEQGRAVAARLGDFWS